MGTIAGLIVVLTLGGSFADGQPAAQKSAKCEKKRVDACGCHHVYGLRHCHPTRKTDHCEAPVKATQDEPRTSSAGDAKTVAL